MSLSAIPGWIITLWRRHLHRKTVKQFFGESSLSIYLPLRHLEDRIVVDEADFTAAVELRRFLEKSRVQAEFNFVDINGKVDLTSSGLVVICGPKMSTAVSAAMSSDEKLVFEEQGGTWQIRDAVKGNVHRSPMDSGEQDGDIAYLARSVRRPGVTQTFISVAGVHAPGSAGAVHYLCNRKRLRRLHRLTRNKSFSAVIECEYLRNPLRITYSNIIALAISERPRPSPRPGTVHTATRFDERENPTGEEDKPGQDGEKR